MYNVNNELVYKDRGNSQSLELYDADNPLHYDSSVNRLYKSGNINKYVGEYNETKKAC